MVAAVAMFAAASCTQELENNAPETVGETVVFTASVDDAQTKAVLDETTRRSEWAEGDEITLHNGTKSYDFTATAAGPCVDFSYTGNDFSGSKFMAVYPAGTYTADPAAKTVKAYIPTWQQAQKGTYHSPAALAVAYTENSTLQFKNAHALLKFTVNTDNVTHVIFHGNNSEAITGDVNVTLGAEGVQVECLKTMIDAEEKYATWVQCYAYHDADNKYFDKGQTYYIAVAPQIFNNGVTVKFKIDDGNEIVVKTTAEKVQTQAGRILNLGELEYIEPEKTYGICGDLTEWSKDGTIPDVPMELVDGKYVAYNVNFEAAGSFKIRVNNRWDEDFGFNVNATVTSGYYYNMVPKGGGNVTIAAGRYDIWFDSETNRIYVVKPGSSIASLTEGTLVLPSSDVWYLIGDFNTWGLKDADYKFENQAGWFVLKNCEFSETGEAKINDGTWDVQRSGTFGGLNGSFTLTGSNNFTLPKGCYDIYMKQDASEIYFFVPGKTPSTTGKYRFYIKNSTSYQNVYLHAWNGYSTNVAWPGLQLTLKADVEGKGSCY